MEAENLRDRESITRSIVELERDNHSGLGEGFEQYKDVFDTIYSNLSEGGNYLHVRDSETMDLLEDLGIATSWNNNLYRIDSPEDLERVEERLEAYDSRGYDDFELIARYRSEAEELGKTPSSRDARASDHMPTANPYMSKYEKWSNAKWRAGFEGHEKLGAELLLEKLKDEIHRINEDRPLDEYEIPTGPELDKIDSAPSERAFRNNDDIGSYDEALTMIGFHRLKEEYEEDEERWKRNPSKIIVSDISDFLENNPSKGTHFMNTQNFQFIDDLLEVAEDSKRSSIRATTKQEGRFYKALDELGLIESWGSGPRYLVEGDPDEFENVREVLSRLTQEDEIMPREVDYTNMLRRVAGMKGDTPTMDEISAHPEAPHGGSFSYHLGKYNNAVIRAGLEPNRTFRPDDELEATLIDIYHLLERRPSPQEVREISGINPSIFHRRHEDGMTGMMDDLNIPTFEDELDNAWDILIEEESSEIETTE
jgi:hypothetical protein